MRKVSLLLVVSWLWMQAAICNVVPQATVPAPINAGATPQSADWNTALQGVCNYINTNVVSALNVLTTTGDIYVYDGAILRRLGITDPGSHSYPLMADSTQITGLKWAAYSGSTPVTNKGDLCINAGSGTSVTNLPVGADTAELFANSSNPKGMSWTVPTNIVQFPSGSIVAWSPAGAGTNTIPAGFLLCDGTNGTPNLIGLFIVGTRPGGSSATPAAGGFGAETVDSAGKGTVQHQHALTTGSQNTSSDGEAPNVAPITGTAQRYALATNINHLGHTHSVTPSGSLTLANCEPSDWALVYMMKQ